MKCSKSVFNTALAGIQGPGTLAPSMTTKNNQQEFLLDKRIVQRNVDKGLIDAKTVEKLHAALPDRTDNVAITSYDDDESTAAGDDEE